MKRKYGLLVRLNVQFVTCIFYLDYGVNNVLMQVKALIKLNVLYKNKIVEQKKVWNCREIETYSYYFLSFYFCFYLYTAIVPLNILKHLFSLIGMRQGNLWLFIWKVIVVYLMWLIQLIVINCFLWYPSLSDEVILSHINIDSKGLLIYVMLCRI